jgi:VanZ family protein
MRRAWLWLPVILWAAMILSASNDAFSAKESASWLERLLGREVPHAINVAVRKCGHLVVYGVLGALAWRAERKITIAMVIAAAVAIADEYQQGLTQMRTGSPWDVLLDLAGAAIAVWLLRRASSGRGHGPGPV